MANQSHELNSAARERAANNRAPTIANLPAVIPPSTLVPRPVQSPPPSTHQCPNCGAWAPTGSSVCAECGGRIQSKPQKIRCRLCGAHASATLVICPDCGRELHAAPSRVLSWGAPTILVVLFLLIMVQRWESVNPLRWVQTQVATSRAWVSKVAERLDPQIEISTLPEAVTARGAVTEGTNDSSAITTGLQSDTLSNTAGNPVGDRVETTLVANPNVLTAPESLPLSPPAQEGAGQGNNSDVNGTNNDQAASVTGSTVITPTATAPEPSPTPTAQPTVQATPTATVDATATPRQTSTSAIVQTAPKQDADAVAAAELNARKVETTTVTILQPTPTTTPTQTATPTPTTIPTQAAVTYSIRAGDTPFGIATQFGITVDELLARNGLSLNDARRLRVGQVLTIVAGTAAPVVEQPTATATATATTQSSTATNTQPADAADEKVAAANEAKSETKSTARVDAPGLRSPENGSSLSCGADNTVTWLPVAYIRESDQYLLHLGFLSGYNGDGSEQVTWILEQWRPSNVTQWELDTGLCGLAPQAFGRQWRWSVEVVEANGNSWQSVSQSSAVWGFSWN
jgi:LysM repeat protein